MGCMLSLKLLSILAQAVGEIHIEESSELSGYSNWQGPRGDVTAVRTQIKTLCSILPQWLWPNSKKYIWKSGSRPPLVNESPSPVSEVISSALAEKDTTQPPSYLNYLIDQDTTRLEE